ncbi:MnhB domain-containing protein [Salsuginibacillus kocurii]|uniref:MnhB domain-containing protein n=1 Tax=Salsuginibacillus kocurii TaxID=427078 RepID=UPI000362DF92|nr:MnhB domain-containing protein [Salsuginibacillus kocurii]
MKTNDLMIKTVGRIISPIVLIFAVYLLFAGHNDSGGEFPAALMAALGFLGIAFFFGFSTFKWIFSKVRFDYLSGLGLVVGLSPGIVNLFLGDPLFTNYHAYPALPLLGEIHLSSQLIFEYGLTLTITCVIMLIVAELTEAQFENAAEESPQ